MNRFVIGLIGLCMLAALPRPASAADPAPNSPQDYDAGRALLKTIQAQAATRKPVLDRPYAFVRSQTKYSGRLFADMYNWHDRPLFASRLLWDDGPSDHKVSSFAKTFEIYQSYGLDGFASFAWPGAGEYQRTMKVIYDTAARMKLDPGSFHILLAVSSDPKYIDIDKNTLALITDNPYSFRINGKSLISSYVMDRMTPEQIEKHIQPLRQRSGDKILFLPMIHFIHLKDANGRPINIHEVHELYRRNGALPASLLKQMQDYLRSYAQVCDGLYIGPLETNLDRTVDAKFAAQVIYPLFKSVLAEPAFNGRKILVAQMKVGYTSYHNSQHLSRDGTKTLRIGFEQALKFQPDLVIGTEWDELNEDTGFEPLVAKPMSSQRIIRYYMSRYRHEAPTPNPGDDLSLPNLIISQRRQLLPGVTMGIELLNVPDTADGQPYTLTLELLNEKNEVVYHAQPQTFNTAQLKDKTFNLPSEQFKEARALRPRLIIDYRGKQRTIDDGLPFTVVRATTAWDQTWFCTPLRNVLQAQKAEVAFKPQAQPIAPGISAVDLSAELQSPEKLAMVEVVQDSHVLFAYDPHDEYLQSDPDRRLIELATHYVNNPSRIYIGYTVKLEGAPSARTFARPAAGSTPNSVVASAKATASEAFTDSPISWNKNHYYGASDWWEHSRLISLKKEDMATAILTIEGTRATGPHRGEKFQWQVPLKELDDYGVVSKVFEDGLMFAVQTQYRPTKMPLPVDAASVQFQHRIVADNPNGVLALRAITEAGKVYWSRPFALNEAPAGPAIPLQVYSSSAKKPVTIPMPKGRLPDIKYDFTPRWGNILHTDAGRQFYGHAGSYLSISTAFTGGESPAFMIPFYLYQTNIFKGADEPAPKWVKLDEADGGGWALQFDGDRGNFLALSNVVIPQRTAFTLTFEIKPKQVKPEQVLFANEFYSYGTINLSVKDGKFQFYFTRRTPDRPDLDSWSRKEFKTDIPLLPGKWQKVMFTYDESKLTLSANGKTESFPFEGIGLYLQGSVFGGQGQKTKAGVIPFYDGLLRSLEIKHYVEP